MLCHSYLRAGRYFKDGWYRRCSCSNHLEQPKIKNSVEVTPRRIIMKKQSRIPALLDIFLKLKVLELILVLKDVRWAYLEWSTLGG